VIPDTLSVKMLPEERTGEREKERSSGGPHRLLLHPFEPRDRSLLTTSAHSAFCFEFQAVQEREEIPCRGDKRDRGGLLVAYLLASPLI
jgi:hypothetical protein